MLFLLSSSTSRLSARAPAIQRALQSAHLHAFQSTPIFPLPGDLHLRLFSVPAARLRGAFPVPAVRLLVGSTVVASMWPPFFLTYSL